MTMHGLAYGLYLISLLFHSAIETVYFLSITTRNFNLDITSDFFDAILGTLSEIFLCVIFWQLAKKKLNRQSVSD